MSIELFKKLFSNTKTEMKKDALSAVFILGENECKLLSQNFNEYVHKETINFFKMTTINESLLRVFDCMSGFHGDVDSLSELVGMNQQMDLE